ncbi:hypothetical protein HS088_TW01G00299 [Tripterygium wilfordii]|uniref:Myb-related protein Myb4-like n=1 Tax=Tripterygium wilfordii TaxID=458696 RepID=A0A7J7E171_TRIWF|nr:transcription factor MYB14-like [Tripterygium wilfordii]KAF5752390.1 hypothetical protein HS088_TW01G00299 [Tripterygium wilfordii]
MVRAPCCEKMGLKKGPWTPEEDRILVSYIHNYGHANWRALPKQAGLLRCGKSCRLRWINYLRPDIKRGNFTKEEEDTIITLHESLGNRWSAIAAQLPGRTDNEIKNVWHTHLKKRLLKQNHTPQIIKHSMITSPQYEQEQVSINADSESSNITLSTHNNIYSCEQYSSLLTDTTTVATSSTETIKCGSLDYAMNFPLMDESCGSSDAENSSSMMTAEFFDGLQDHFGFNYSNVMDPSHMNEASYVDDGMDFWRSLLIDVGGIQGFL